MIFTILAIWFGVMLGNAVVYEMLKDDKPIVYTPVLPVTEGWHELVGAF